MTLLREPRLNLPKGDIANSCAWGGLIRETFEWVVRKVVRRLNISRLFQIFAQPEAVRDAITPSLHHNSARVRTDPQHCQARRYRSSLSMTSTAEPPYDPSKGFAWRPGTPQNVLLCARLIDHEQSISWSWRILRPPTLSNRSEPPIMCRQSNLTTW